jgi:hypothetical protein
MSDKPVARLLHRRVPAYLLPETIARTYSEFPTHTAVGHWDEGEPLFAHPPKIAELSIEQIIEISDRITIAKGFLCPITFYKAIQAKYSK